MDVSATRRVMSGIIRFVPRRVRTFVVLAIAVSVAAFVIRAREPSYISRPRLVEAGWSGGFCMGPCLGSVVFSGRSIDLTATITGPGARTKRRISAALTERGIEHLGDVLSAARVPDHDTTFSRKGIVDAASGWLVLANERGAKTRHSFYPESEPPAQFARLHEFTRAVVDRMAACGDSPDLRTTRPCVPLET
jgi:hypothetical protein